MNNGRKEGMKERWMEGVESDEYITEREKTDAYNRLWHLRHRRLYH